MRSVHALALIATSAFGCAPESLEMTNSPIVSGLDRELEVTRIVTPAGRSAVAPYLGATFDVRIEMGLSSPDRPEVAVFPARVLANLDEDWIGLPPQGWDEPTHVEYRDRDRWAGIWQGQLPDGALNEVVIDLSEDVHVVVDDVAYDAALPVDERQLSFDLNVDTDHPAPVVLTVLLSTNVNGGVVNWDIEKVLVREVDSDGFPQDYRPETVGE